MAREAAVPAADDKAGKKIDYLAAQIGRALAPHGFRRQGRKLVAEGGEGVDRHWRIVDLQADEWNSGPNGRFHVNVSLQFPAVIEVRARQAGREWMREHLAKPDGAMGQLRERLDALAPDAPGGHVSRGSDLPALAAALAAALERAALPWFDAHARVAAVRDFEGSMIVCDITTRLAAALALGDVAAVPALLQRHPAAFSAMPKPHRAELQQWLAGFGADGSALDAPPPPPPPRPPRPAPDPAAAAGPASETQAWLAAQRELQRRAAAEIEAWSKAADQDLATLPPDAALLSLLDRLVARQRQAPDFASADFDDSLGPRVQPLLEALTQPTLATCEAVLERLVALAGRRDPQLVTATYRWPFAALVAWLDRCAAPHRQALKPSVQRWLDAFADAVVEHHRTHEHLVPEPPPPNDRASVRQRLREVPEQSLGREDREAVATLRRWLRRDPATDRVPLAFEPDDWGAPSQAAWDALDASVRAELLPVFEHLADSATAQPTARWLKAFEASLAALPPPVAETARGWWHERLLAFEHTAGVTQWATTGARPGWGARLGDTGEALLLGGLWWCWLDRAVDRATLAAVLRRVAAAAWRHLPEVGARSPTVGGLALRLLAGLGDEGRAAVQAIAAGQPRPQLKRAVEQALAKAAPRAAGPSP